MYRSCLVSGEATRLKEYTKMDFSKLEYIVAKRKLPPTPSTGNKHRRVALTSMPPLPTARSLPTPLSPQPSTSKISPPPSPSLLTTADNHHHYQYEEEEEEEDEPRETIQLVHQTDSCATGLLFPEPTLIVKQRFHLSETLYVLVGLASEMDMEPTMYLVDKKLWLRIMFTPDCLNIITDFSKRIECFFKNPSAADQVLPIYTECLKIKSMMEDRKPHICFEKYTRPNMENPELDSLQDYFTDLQDACWNILEDLPLPDITMNRSEWKKFSHLAESIIEYYNLISQCKSPATRLIKKYTNDFKLTFRSMAISGALQQQDQQQRMKEDIKVQLPIRIKKWHYTKLITEVSDYDKGMLSPLGTWLDAEIRGNCNHLISFKVMEELKKEFKWLI